MVRKDLTNKIYKTMLSLATTEGINASGKEEIYGCIFGRDSFITILKLLNVLHNESDFDSAPLKEMCFRSLKYLITLQGRETNLNSGEEPGKFIHEYRKEGYEHLVNRPIRPWFLYPDKIMRNYDSLDSTPLGLIAIYKYWKTTKDDSFLINALPAVESGLNWIITYGDLDKDQLLEYVLPKERESGGLAVQSWTDSKESLTREDGTFPDYPIAPVEVQGYAWLALKLWADFYETGKNYAKTKKFSEKLRTQAREMKNRFNQFFIFESEGMNFAAQALDGYKNQIQTVTGNPLLLLWATYFDENGRPEAIMERRVINSIVKRSFLSDLFDEEAGIRTMSVKSTTFNPRQDSYHNGSFWPKLNGMAHEGLRNWGFEEEAERLKEASLRPIDFFESPIELYIKNEGGYLPYLNDLGQQGCREQAWSAACALDLLTR